jgi:hypothetical protein
MAEVAAQNAASIKAAVTQLQVGIAQLEARRSRIVGEMNGATEAARDGLRESLENINGQIRDLDEQIAGLNRSLAAPLMVNSGSEAPPAIPVDPNIGIPENAMIVITVFTLAVLFPISLGVTRWLWKRGPKGGPVASAGPSPEVLERLSRMEHTMDSVAVEVERISEGQRFVTKLMNESGPKALGVGQAPAEMIKVPQGDDALRVSRERTS